jgi:hypothetical protein
MKVLGLRRLGLATALLLGAACLEDNSLSGSMSEVFPLGVSRVEVYKNDEAIQVTYLANRGIYLDVVARVTIALHYPDGGTNSVDGGFLRPLVPGTDLDVAGDYLLGHPIASVVHAPGGEPVRLLPPVQKGDFHVSAGGQPGVMTSGDFSMVFMDTGGDIGFGRTLVGRFSGVAVDAGFGPLP